jgi:hypothetical protein
VDTVGGGAADERQIRGEQQLLSTATKVEAAAEVRLETSPNVSCNLFFVIEACSLFILEYQSQRDVIVRSAHQCRRVASQQQQATPPLSLNQLSSPLCCGGTWRSSASASRS